MSTKTIEFKFSAAEITAAEQKAFEKEGGKYTVQGFRKGKAPKRIIEQNYGPVFSESAIEDLFSTAYIKYLSEHPEVKPIDHPSVDIKEKDGGMMLTATIDVEPTFTLGKYKGLEIKKTKIEITDKEVDKFLAKTAAERARQIAADKNHKIEMGNIAVIDFSGFVDGKQFDGGTAQNHQLEIGSHSFIDTFEEQLVGHKIGDKIDVNVTFPAEYHAKELAGAKALFKVEVRNILVKHLPAIDDKLAKEASEFNTLDEFKKDIKNRLETQAIAEVKREDENALLKTVVGQTKIEIPAKMTEQQLGYIMHDLEQKLGGVSVQQYAQYIGMPFEQFVEMQRAQAEMGVKSRLVFDAIITKEKLSVSAEEIDAKVKQVGAKIDKNDKRQLAYIEQDLLFDKLVGLLRKENKFS